MTVPAAMSSMASSSPEGTGADVVIGTTVLAVPAAVLRWERTKNPIVAGCE
ncbi:hypothetical protein STXM2123_2136 [Streptomyces sp. F-3]|nr:hypothetical protein STXM2123_2136 [Streptomyces sp. F-3]